MKGILLRYSALWLIPFALFLTTCGGNGGGSGGDSGSSSTSVDPATPGYKELGSGTDVFEEYASENNVKGKVLNIDALNNQKLLVLNTSVQEGMIQRVSGTSVSQYASELGVTVGLKGSYKWFSASIKTAFTDNTYRMSEYSYVTLMERHYKNSLKIENTKWNSTYLKNYLTTDADKAINNTDPQKDWTPEQIISTFGTHVMVGIFTGARLDYNLSIKITNTSHQTNLQAYAETKANFKFASASFSAGLNQTTYDAMKTYEQRENILAKGGNEQYARPGNNVDYQLWKASIDSNPALVGIIKDGLVPIWELADNPIRAAAIQNYYTEYALGKDSAFTPLPIHSAFDANMDVENWTAPNSGGFAWHLQDNPSQYGGHIEGIDGGLSPWWFQANAKYTGDMQGFYGGELSYWFRWRGSPISDCAFRKKDPYYYQDKYWRPDVEIKGLNGTSIGYFFPDPGAAISPPGANVDSSYFGAPDYYNNGLKSYDDWFRYALPMSEYYGKEGEYAYGWIKNCYSYPCYTPATKEEILGVLQGVDYVRIRGEYCFGAQDRGMLDEVWLKAPNP
jgi:hypothetical protein